MILQLQDGAVALLTKAIEEEGLEICTEGMQKHWKYALKVCRSIGLLMNMLRLGEFRFGIMDTWGGSEERRSTRRLRHLRTIGVRTWQSSAYSSGMIAMD
jgi:hypothetical protein